MIITIIAASIMMNIFDKSEPVVRPATQAGRFYDGNAGRLSHEVDSFLTLHAHDRQYQDVAAIIVPHAGYYFSGNVAAAAYMLLPKDKPYKRIFLLGPSHHEWLDGASVNSEADYYETPLGRVRVDRETARKLLTSDGDDADSASMFSYRPEAHDREHCLEVQLPFLQRRFTSEVPPIVPIIISTNDYTKLKRMAEALKPYFTDENLFIVSSDFSHYPSYEDACKVDAKTGKAVESGDVEAFIATIDRNAKSGIRNLATSACGGFPIITLMLMLDGNYEVKHLLYQNSGDIDDSDLSRVVGYHAFAILRGEKKEFSLTDEEKSMLKPTTASRTPSMANQSLTSHLLPLTSIPSVAPLCRSIRTAVCVAASDISARIRPCMRLWQRWLVRQLSKTRGSRLYVARSWTMWISRFPSLRPCGASRAWTSSSCIGMAFISARAIAVAHSCHRWLMR